MHRQELAQMRLKRFPIASFSMLFSVVPLFELLGILMKDEGSWLVLIVDNCAGCRCWLAAPSCSTFLNFLALHHKLGTTCVTVLQ